jgi:tetratricopeptide (TPR) repeat protein
MMVDAARLPLMIPFLYKKRGKIFLRLSFLMICTGMGCGFYPFAWADAPEPPSLQTTSASSPESGTSSGRVKSEKRSRLRSRLPAHKLSIQTHVLDIWAAYEALRKGQLAEARRLYVSFVGQRPQSRDGLLGLLFIDHALGDDRQVQQDLANLSLFHSHDPSVAGAQFLINGGDPGLTESRLRTMMLRLDQPGPLYFSLGVLYTDQQRWADARLAFQKAVALDPTQLDYIFNLALVTDVQGDTAQARNLYERLLTLLEASHQRAIAFDRDAVVARLNVLSNLSPIPNSSSHTSPTTLPSPHF